ncbi:MAG TPA: response regulator, partial [Methylophilaceae bacterium]|nr:response regulator [Methylophilaceae bacterium]
MPPPSAPQVLVIEDDSEIAFLLQFMLQREGLDVLPAADGRAAEQMIADLAQPPSLVLLDVMLPYVDGMQLLRQIRAKPGWEAVPVIMLTAKSSEPDIVRALG